MGPSPYSALRINQQNAHKEYHCIQYTVRVHRITITRVKCSESLIPGGATLKTQVLSPRKGPCRGQSPSLGIRVARHRWKWIGWVLGGLGAWPESWEES